MRKTVMLMHMNINTFILAAVEALIEPLAAAKKAGEREEINREIAALNKLTDELDERLVALSSRDLKHFTKRQSDNMFDTYYKTMGELHFEPRARPSDRTKTPEEIAQEEREALEKLEEERLNRMHATDEDEDYDGTEDEIKSSSRLDRYVSGDDLGDSISTIKDSGKEKGWVDAIYERCLTFPCSDFRHVVLTPVSKQFQKYYPEVIGVFSNASNVKYGEKLKNRTTFSVLFRVTLMMVFQYCQSHLELKVPRPWLHIDDEGCAVHHIDLFMILEMADDSAYFMSDNFKNIRVTLMMVFQYCQSHLELKVPRPWLHIDDEGCAVHHIDLFMILEMADDSAYFMSDNFKASMLSFVVKILMEFVIMYQSLSSFPEIFLPIAVMLHEVLHGAKLPGILRSNMEEVAGLISTKASEYQLSRQPLQMRKLKPEPIKLMNPKFEENFVKGINYDPDRERAQRKKLKKLLKKEAKGAVRELRKDNHFLFELKERDRLLQEEERSEKYGKALAFLQEQEHAFKSGQLGKGRKRRK
ncbi:hypothetical protein IEQ34_016193 [Dendrobium chrysotoxum]|uniref:Uncharacterized protein n=1 Tax=Dendrobium chrysotoxum TaxID=161865 RepID=A0AAV7GEE3_DENCH|nr:hypothetical protein IEQ34_016193 [Dendrobium chrysotoxum]